MAFTPSSSTTAFQDFNSSIILSERVAYRPKFYTLLFTLGVSFTGAQARHVCAIENTGKSTNQHVFIQVHKLWTSIANLSRSDGATVPALQSALSQFEARHQLMRYLKKTSNIKYSRHNATKLFHQFQTQIGKTTKNTADLKYAVVFFHTFLLP